MITNCPNCGSNIKLNLRDCDFCGTALILISPLSISDRQIDNISLDNAISKNKIAENKNHEDFESIFNLGILYLNKGILEIAISYFRKAINIRPDDINSRFNLALCLYDDGKMKLVSAQATELKDQLKTVLMLDPTHREANSFTAFFEARYNESNPDMAIINYRKAISFCDDIVVFHLNLSTLLYNNKRYKEAIDVANKCMEKHNYNFQNYYVGKIYNILAVSYQMSGNKTLAISNIVKAIEYEPNDPIIIGNLSNIKNTFYIFGKAFSFG
jgi:tetratricopeptide (TPR) repeat protein